MSFAELGLSEEIVKNVTENGFSTPFAIQKEVIPEFISGKDILAIAQTGSGKTAAYVIPVLQKLQTKKELKSRHVRVLVLVPTRELAVQVAGVFRTLSSGLKNRIKSLAVYGGVSINPQMMNMNGVEILVATPGRLLDLTLSNAVNLSQVDTLIIDEADKLFNLGFEEDINKIFSQLPTNRQSALFSATLSEKVETIRTDAFKNPVVIQVSENAKIVDKIDYRAYLVAEERKGPFLRYLIKNENMNQVLVFVASGQRADNVVKKLVQNGIKAIAFHGKKSQGHRTDALVKFKAKRIQVLVATDLASRGLDINELPFVINYELPRSPKDFVHRVGRTARAGSCGEAISLIGYDEEHHFKVIQKKNGLRIATIETDDIDIRKY